MRILKKILSFRWRTGIWAGLGLILAASVALTVFMLYLQPGVFRATAWDFVVRSHYALFFLNWAPIVLSMLFLYFLFNNVSLACGIPGLIVTAASLVNSNMIAMRTEPFKPLDIFLTEELMGISKSIDKRVFIIAGAALAAFAVALALALIFIRNKKKKLLLRGIGLILSVAAFIPINHFLLGNQKIYESFYIAGSPYNLVDNFQSRGFLYSFVYTWDNLKIVKPPDYSQYKSVIDDKISSFQPDPALQTKEKPNIIMILGEAYSEFGESPVINFDGYDYPYTNYDQIKADSVSGTLIVPGIGGGTADTEFDILTGVSTRHFRGNPYSFSLVNKPYDAMAAWLSRLGYANTAIHPGAGWFYNRSNVYPLLGFSGFQDISVFPNANWKGGYITEADTVAKFISEYQAHMDSDPNTPFFEFGITIQNHGPYKDKYGNDVPQNFNSTVDLTPDAVNALSNYFVGIKDVDAGLKTLTDYFSQRNEPVVVIYFGDHAPSFTYNIYNALVPKLGTDYDDQTRLYRTPFFIWQNDAAKNSLGIDQPSGESMTSNYFGAWVMKLLGFSGLDPFVDFLNQIEPIYPVMLENQFAEYQDGQRVLEPFTQQPDEVGIYRSWEYSIVEGK
ncbi:MAG: LTA synthase family protein [Defluviitaleaceae bacterium]|nr:LTA synthase family protein [Defluviitaleaceae bacterium]